MPRHLRPSLTSPLLACGLALGLILAAGPAASASTARARGPLATAWYGYVDTSSAGNTYSKVAGDWAVPAASCTVASSALALWVGIDGYSSPTVEQAGTAAACTGGSVTYYAWWEMYPGPAHIVSLAVHPGDQMAVSVGKSGTKYTIKVTNATDGTSFSTTQACYACTDTSAEWIAEPAGGYPPASIHWKLTNGTATSGSVSGVIGTFPHVALGTPLTSGLNAAGNSFTVT